MPNKPYDQIAASQITPEAIYKDRRRLMQGMATAAAVALVGCDQAAEAKLDSAAATPPKPQIPGIKAWAGDVKDARTSFRDASEYNNFYEFGTDKSEPARKSSAFKPRPWRVEIAGEAEVTGSFDLDELLKGLSLEERVYRLRCVEAWSMVIPWVGFPLSSLLTRFKPTSKAKYVAFTTIERPEQMPGQRWDVLNWPYREGLRIDEAMHPLTLFAVGMYGRWLPNQNGAPLRLVVPWKYGFKSIKSIVRIEFRETQPYTSWNDMASDEYGFYANVNPKVDHPRWSQASERRIAEGVTVFNSRIPTLPFNGYTDQVGGLYRDLDLAKFF